MGRSVPRALPVQQKNWFPLTRLDGELPGESWAQGREGGQVRGPEEVSEVSAPTVVRMPSYTSNKFLENAGCEY